MVIRNYFYATRDPARGGLHISLTSENFPKDCLEVVEKECLEITSADYQRNACAVFPISNNRFIIMMAKKTHGTQVESRPHEHIHGILVTAQEFAQIYRNNMAQEWFDQVFFPMVTKGELELAGDAFSHNFDLPNRLGDYKRRMEASQLIGFYNTLMEVIHKKRKVHLIVPTGMERTVQALCYDILPEEEKGNLFVISNGECTMSDADILITKEINYQDFRKYKKLTLEEFISYGLRVKKPVTPMEEKPKRMTVEEAVESCLDYILDENAVESKISLIRKTIMEQSEPVCEEFQLKLRCELEDLYVKKNEFVKYVQMLALAFENYKGECKERKQVMLAIPYDMQGYMRFLDTRCESDREKERYIKVFFEQLLEQYGIFWEKADLKKIIKNYKRDKEN